MPVIKICSPSSGRRAGLAASLLAVGLCMGTSSFAAASYQDLLKLFEDDAMTVTLGFNNVLDEDRPACNPCGCIGMIRTSHDITGTVGYVRVTYQHE